MIGDGDLGSDFLPRTPGEGTDDLHRKPTPVEMDRDLLSVTQEGTGVLTIEGTENRQSL